MKEFKRTIKGPMAEYGCPPTTFTGKDDGTLVIECGCEEERLTLPQVQALLDDLVSWVSWHEVERMTPQEINNALKDAGIDPGKSWERVKALIESHRQDKP